MKVSVKEIVENFDKYKGRLVRGFPGLQQEVYQLVACTSPIQRHHTVEFVVKVIKSRYLEYGFLVYRYAAPSDYLILIPKLKEIILTKGGEL